MIEAIQNAKPEEMDEILQAVRIRYRELFPQWELMILSVDRKEDRNQQLDTMIGFLQNLKQK